MRGKPRREGTSRRAELLTAHSGPVQGSRPGHPPDTRPPLSAARWIGLIGPTLALGDLIVLGGTYVKGDFLVDSDGQRTWVE
jgi:hypothetical protein